MDSQGKPSLSQPPTSHYTRLVGSEEQKIYDHLLKAIQSESSDKILDRV